MVQNATQDLGRGERCEGVPADICRGETLDRLRNRWRRFVLRAGAPLARHVTLRASDSFGILLYHRVAPVVDPKAEPTWNVPPERFQQQLEGLLDRGYQAWPLRELLSRRSEGRAIPAKVFAVTFDDGYECVWRHAWPILRRLGVPATVFVATAYLDQRGPMPFDDWPAAGRGEPCDAWRPLTVDQCAEMLRDELVDIGSHSHSHCDFRGHPEQLRGDLLRSREALRESLGLTEALFSFPYGRRRWGFSGPPLARAAAEAGMLCALTADNRLVRRAQDPFDWGRFGAEADDDAGTLAVYLEGWYDLLSWRWRSLASRGAAGRTEAA